MAGREEERRRIRRDLHDGVGPSLAAIVLKLNAAESRTEHTERSALVAEARQEVRQAIAEVRRLVDDLRPPAIDEVGLLAAIRQRAAALSGDLTIEVAGPDPMPALPAAVEVAAFRIASEAMTNVARHAAATRCRVDLVVNGRFELTVADNGRGADSGAPTTGRGAGWISMRERAAELGGTCTISHRPEGGMVVHAIVPLGRPQAKDGARGGPRMIRLLVVDDHPAFRRGLELMLAGVDDIEIAGEAETGLRAVELAGKLSPDVILMDLRMPDLDGIEATRRITRHAMRARDCGPHDVRR